MGLSPIAVTLLQEVVGWVVIVAIFGWFVWYFAAGVVGPRKVQDLRTGRVRRAWWLGRRRRRKPPGPFLRS
jgi:hypothetical protein